MLALCLGVSAAFAAEPPPSADGIYRLSFYGSPVPATKKGVVYLFKPSAVADTITIKLRGVDPARRYRVSFENGSNPAAEKTGAELMAGLDVTLRGAPVSELVFIEAV